MNTIKSILLFSCTVLLSQLIVSSLYAQRSKDAIEISNSDYMKFADAVNCDSIEGVSSVEKICLNLAFQRIDSILTRRMNTYFLMSNDSIEQSQKKDYHASWLANRRFQSASIAKDFDGHYKDIYYTHHEVVWG